MQSVQQVSKQIWFLFSLSLLQCVFLSENLQKRFLVPEFKVLMETLCSILIVL